MAPPPSISTCLLVLALLAAQTAALPAAPPVTKPRLVPRPVPGTTGGNATPKTKAPLQAASPRRVPVPAPAEGAATDEVRIIQIIRKGTPGLPTVVPAQTTGRSSLPALPQQEGPGNGPHAGTGRVRVLTQAEAEVLATQTR